MNPKHGGPELSPLTLNFAVKLSVAIHNIIEGSRSVATVVNVGLSTNISEPLKCSVGAVVPMVRLYFILSSFA